MDADHDYKISVYQLMKIHVRDVGSGHVIIRLRILSIGRRRRNTHSHSIFNLNDEQIIQHIFSSIVTDRRKNSNFLFIINNPKTFSVNWITVHDELYIPYVYTIHVYISALYKWIRTYCRLWNRNRVGERERARNWILGGKVYKFFCDVNYVSFLWTSINKTKQLNKF